MDLRQTSESMSSRNPTILPPELVAEILSRLPVKPLARFRSVSKSFASLLSSETSFIQKHLHRTLKDDANLGMILHNKFSKKLSFYLIPSENFEQTIELDTSYLPLPKKSGTKTHFVQMLGSLNGLVCLVNIMGDGSECPGIHLWSPATRRVKTLPPCLFPGIAKYGFGVDSTCIDYKVLRLRPLNDTHHTIVEAYTISTDCWKLIGYFSYSFHSMIGKLTNGRLHWGAGGEKGFTGKLEWEFILSFGMDDDKFYKVQLPLDIQNQAFLDNQDLFLHVSRGCLSVISQVRFTIDIWVMTEYGVEDSWSKLFTIKHPVFSPLNFMKNGDLLLLEGRAGSDYPGELGIYNFETKEFKNIEFPGIEVKEVDAESYVESLVQVKATHEG